MARTGRPLIKIDLKKVEKLAGLGLSEKQICNNLHVSEDTMMRRKRTYADFADAYTRGRARGLEMVAGELRKNVKDRNVQAQMFYLRCHGGEQWTEKQADINVNVRKDEARINSGLAAVLVGSYHRRKG